MRTLPRSTRVAIATLYVRLRDARRREARTRDQLGIGSVAALKAMGETIDASNALIAVRDAVFEQQDGPFHDAHEFVRLMGLRGRAFARAA